MPATTTITGLYGEGSHWQAWHPAESEAKAIREATLENRASRFSLEGFSFDEIFITVMSGKKSLVLSELKSMAPVVLGNLSQMGPYQNCMRAIFKGRKKVKINWGYFIDHPAEAVQKRGIIRLGPSAFIDNFRFTDPKTGKTVYQHWLSSLSYVLAHELFHICGAGDEDKGYTDADDFAQTLFGPPLITWDPRP